MPAGAAAQSLPYRLACLCDLRDDKGRILLIRRHKEPNKGLCSPIGGKLDMERGESPAQCAQREIHEEAGIDVPISRLHLGGLISEAAYEGKGHWLLFYYRVLGPVRVEPRQIKEGRLEWFDAADIDALPLPETDRRIIWPLIRRNEAGAVRAADADTAKADGALTPTLRPGFFALHIDCTRGAGPPRDNMTWTIEQEG